QSMRRERRMLWELSIAAAFFDVPGFDLIASELKQVAKVRLLLGAEPVPEAARRLRWRGGPLDAELPLEELRDSLNELECGLARARDLLPFDDQADRALRRLLEYLHSGKIEVRRYEAGFLHAKAFLFRVEGGGVLAGSSNLTYSGLRSNLELNLGHYEDAVVEKVEHWFDELWQAASPYDLAALFDRLMAEYPPYLIYLRVLWELYGQELEEERAETAVGEELPITSFQRHGVWRAMRILKACGGVLVADGVGLGKTFLAGEIIRIYRERRQRVLLVCPAALRDSTWREFLHEFQLYVDCVSYEELARDRQFGGDQPHLRSPSDEYALVVIDEAHNYRNPDAPSRAGALRRLLMGPRRDVLMLTATPVNNSLWDLYHLLRYFIKQDALLADRGVLSIRDRFNEAMEEEPFNLNPDLLYPVIDATTVKRTRRFIKRHYENELINVDGTRVPIHFPKPVASSINYDLDDVLPGFFEELEAALSPPHASPRLKMARYQPERYLLDADDDHGDSPLVGLVRTGLLKRFESSAYAFGKTAENMVREHDLFLEALDRGVVVKKDLLHELSAADDEDAIADLFEASPHTESVENYDADLLREHVAADRDLLEELRVRAAAVRPENDPKLAALVEELGRIAKQAADQAIDDEDQRRKQKVLVFSYYADTVDWIEGYLRTRMEKHTRLDCYRGRLASVAGHESRHGIHREQAVHGFAPESSGGPPSMREDRFDLLICTDVLAEGMNLQQCRNIINYDLPWNPMRLVQRHGRIDRIGSKHDRVFLRTFFPDAQLERLLNLEGRVRRKLAQAARSVGVEVAPIEGGEEGHQTFSESRDEIERLHAGDATLYDEGGTAAAAQSGEEYRQELRQALAKRKEEITSLPWKAGSGMVKGRRRGHFFCAAVGERRYLRFVPFEGGPIASEIGTCLRLIECSEKTPLVIPLDLKQTAFSAWERARQDIFKSWMHETDPANLQPRV
ncbi:MAG TPA: helicase-related protein, partial [Pirellulales bacterium]|nr:helicase-related protein [Pirellulales bacterium]